jgi:hypothetical protein
VKGASPPLRMSHSLNLVAGWLVLFGGGSSSASGAVRKQAEAVGSPIFLMGKGEGEVAGNEDFYEVAMWWAPRWREPTESRVK